MGITMASEGEAVEFLKIKTAAGAAIELSEGHMIPVGDIALDQLKLAEQVVVGVVVVNGVVGSHFTIESTWTNRRMAVFWYKLLDMMPHGLRALLDGPVDVRA